MTAAALMLLAASSSPATASAPVRFEATGCVEGVAAVPVPAANVEHELPADVTATTVGDRALLGVAVMHCDSVVAGGATLRDVHISDVGVAIEPPAECAGRDDCGGVHFFQLWQVTDNPVLRARSSSAGVPSSSAADMTLEMTSLAAGTRAKGAVPWLESPYAVEAVVAGPTAGDAVAGTPNWWYATRGGLGRIRYSFPGTTLVGTGSGSVTADPQTRLAHVLGGPDAVGAGLVVRATHVSATAG